MFYKLGVSMITTNDFIVRNTFNSNAIEGNKLIIDDVYNILITSNFIVNEVNNKDYQETINHKEAWKNIINFSMMVIIRLIMILLSI